MKQDEAIVAPLFASAVMDLSVIDYNLQVAPSYVLDPLFPILGPLSTAELLPAGEAERYRWEDGTEVLRVRRRQYFAAFQTFFCDSERVAQWLRAFQLVGNAPDGFRDEERLDSIEGRGFVCQPELAGVTIEYRENKIRQIAFSIRFDPSKLVSLTDSDAKLGEMIQAVQRRSPSAAGRSGVRAQGRLDSETIRHVWEYAMWRGRLVICYRRSNWLCTKGDLLRQQRGSIL